MKQVVPKTFRSFSSANTIAFADRFIPRIRETTVFALWGNLGSGKTTFVKGLAKSLGIKKTITSPTFTLLQAYALSGERSGWTLYHFDLYRLKKIDDFLREGFDAILYQPKSVIVIEWPKLVAPLLDPQKTFTLAFSQKNKTKKRGGISGSASERVITVRSPAS